MNSISKYAKYHFAFWLDKVVKKIEFINEMYNINRIFWFILRILIWNTSLSYINNFILWNKTIVRQNTFSNVVFGKKWMI